MFDPSVGANGNQMERFMSAPVIIFGGIGTLMETSELQRQAFNDAFKSLDIDFIWVEEAYRASLLDSGGANRLSKLRLKTGRFLNDDEISAVHAAKTDRFVARLNRTKLPLRAGVMDLIQGIGQSKGRIAWATTTSDANIDAVLAASGGALTRDMFDFIGNDKIVTRQKPDPEIYHIALKALNVLPNQVLAVEDSLTGVQSAKAAGLKTIAFPGDVNSKWNMSSADEVVSTLDGVIVLSDA